MAVVEVLGRERAARMSRVAPSLRAARSPRAARESARSPRRAPALALAFGVALAAALSGCAGADPVPFGTPMPPAAVTSPTPAPPPPRVTTVPVVPIQGSDLGARVVPAALPPTRLAVDAVGIDMEVVPVGVDPNGQMTLPEDSGQAGWYRFGPTPAAASGTTLIAAHVDSLVFGLGQFVRLRDVTAGATVQVVTSDGTVHGYTVTQVTRTPKTEVDLGRLFDRSGAPRLVLVTCGGVFDRDTGHYLDNVIVVATPVAGGPAG